MALRGWYHTASTELDEVRELGWTTGLLRGNIAGYSFDGTFGTDGQISDNAPEAIVYSMLFV